MVLNTKTISDHLKTHGIEKETKPVKTPFTQPKIYEQKKPLSSSKSVNFNLTMAFATGHISKRFIENNYLKNAFKIVNVQIPTAKTLSKNILNISAKLKNKMICEIQSLSNFSICVDFWSKNMKGYIGISLNYVKNDRNLKNMVLGVRRVEYPHTSDVVLESTQTILEEYSINGICIFL